MADPTPAQAKAKATDLFKKIKAQSTQASVRVLATEGIKQMGFIALSANRPPPILDIVPSSITGGSFTVEWSNPGNAVQYKVYLNGVLSLTTVGFIHGFQNLIPLTNYVVHVEAIEAGGVSSFSAPKSVQTGANQAPLWDLVIPQLLDQGVPYSFDYNLKVVDPDTHTPIVISQVSGMPAGLALAAGVVSGTPSGGGVSNLVLDAYDGYNHSQVTVQYTVQVPQDLTPPTDPVLATPVVVGNTISVDLATASTDASGIASYRMSRKSPGDIGFVALSPVLATEGDFPWFDTGMSAGLHEYRCRATDASPNANVSNFSPTVSGTVVGTADPAIPVQLAAVLTSSDDARITWAENTTGAHPDDYDLQYSHEDDGGSASGPWQNFAVGNVLQADQLNIPTGRTWYRVRANLTGATSSAYTTPVMVTVGINSQPADFIIPRLTGGNATTSWSGATLRAPLTGGAARKVQGGDVIEFEGGTWRPIVLTDIIGTAADPITIRCPNNDQVIFRRSAPSGSGFVVQWKNCRYCIVDGETTFSGVPVTRDGKRHGFKWMYANGSSNTNKDNPTALCKFKGLLSNPVLGSPYSVPHHMKFRFCHFDMGWSATAPSLSGDTGGICFDSNDHNYERSNFPGQYQEEMVFEEFLAENTGGEATYFGGNPYTAYGQEYPDATPPLRGIRCRNFMVYNTGGQAIQIKSAFGGVGGGDNPGENSVHDGIIIRCTASLGPATNGTPAIALNSSKVDVYNMWFEGCGVGCIGVNVSEGTNIGFPDPSTDFKVRIYNCVMVDNNRLDTGNGIRVSSFTGGTTNPPYSVNNKPKLPAAYKPDVHIFCNTILRHVGGPAIKYETSGGSGGSIENNLAVASGAISGGPITPGSSNDEVASQTGVFLDPAGDTNYADVAAHLATFDLQLAVPRPCLGSQGSGTPSGWADLVDIPADDFGHTTRVMPGSNIGAYD